MSQAKSSGREAIEKFLSENKNAADWLGLRHVKETTRTHYVRNDAPDVMASEEDEGVMLEVLCEGQIGYSGTSDFSQSGLKRALVQALATTKAAAKRQVVPMTTAVRPASKGSYKSPRLKSFDSLSMAQIVDTLVQCSKKMAVSEKIVSRVTAGVLIETETDYVSSNGADIHQETAIVGIDMWATAQEGLESQIRSFNGSSSQQGAEAFDLERLLDNAERTAREALELIGAENCPTGTMDLVAMPQQMDLQIHESIGHPLELDRILGDERNYAGWSFVKPEDFGKLRYGSPLMNITFDPTYAGQMASYMFDDGGAPATKQYLIKDGILVRGIGGLESQFRSKLPGVADFRASGWNRAPIDRMANINLEPGNSTLEEMIAQVERGVCISTNRSWSIDDYRNKFQFGAEYGRRIENGKLTKTVKNPNYRGTTVAFWNKLAAVGKAELRQSFGQRYCGKGEPNQIIRVGHASPPCLFRQVEVFGGLP
jgi:predicted Zn-dependent protease